MRSILEEEQTAIDLQHINVKLLLEGAADLDPVVFDAIIPILHGWIQSRVVLNQDDPELLIDVADYRHVHHGPGIVLIGHEADYAIDNTDGRLGLRYNRKAQLTAAGPSRNDEKLTQAIRAALTAAKHLEEDTRLNGKLHFNGHDIEIFINDRLLVPTNDETRRALDPVLRQVLTRLFAGTDYSVRYESNPRRLFGASIHTERVFSIAELIANLTP
jgi:hypothetical protein